VTRILRPRALPASLLLLAAAFAVLAPSDCRREGKGGTMGSEDACRQSRLAMVRRQIEARGVRDRRVLDAIRAVRRHRFVPPDQVDRAYQDNPLPIGYDQTISQPYIVALMTELLDLEAGEKVLEIGTGSGYQAAVLAELTDRVFSIEIVPELARMAARNLRNEEYDAVRLRTGDGYRGWPEEAPFEAIIVTAAPGHVPRPLIEQLAEGGRLVIPVGDARQELLLLVKEKGEVRRRSIIPVRFVPMTGEAEEH